MLDDYLHVRAIDRHRKLLSAFSNKMRTAPQIEESFVKYKFLPFILLFTFCLQVNHQFKRYMFILKIIFSLFNYRDRQKDISWISKRHLVS